MQPYLLSPSERIRHWRTFRSSLDASLSDEEHLMMTMNYWNQYPIVTRYIDPYTPENWPTPWELLTENEFCSSSLAYMMEQTLLMSADKRWLPNRLSLKYIDDKELSAEFIILVIDDKYVINYDLSSIINFDFIVKSCIIRHEYSLENNVHFIV